MSVEGIDQEELMIFLEEMDELLQVLEEDMLKLEKEPRNPSLVAEIFRAAHTIKGSAATVGFPNLSKLAHAMEAVFSEVRSGKLAVTAGLVDTFFHCLDTVRAIKREIVGAASDSVDIAPNLSMLAKLSAPDADQSPLPDVEQPEPEAKPPAEERTPEPQAPSIYRFFRIRADVAQGCLMPFVRAYQALTFLSETGSLIESNPRISEIEAEEKSFPLEVVISTTAGEARLREIMEMISDVIVLDITDVEEEEDEQGAAEPAAGPEAVIAAEPASPQEPPPAQQPVPETLPIETAQAPGPAPDAEPPSAAAPAPEMAVVKEVHPPPGQTDGAEPQSSPDAASGFLEYPHESKDAQARSIRVNVERVDAIMDLVGELVINRTRLTQLSRSLEVSLDSEETTDPFNETADSIELITAQLQEHIMKARLLPIENVFNKFPRAVRSLAKKYGKKIDLVVTGEQTELDRSVLEQIGDPLMHAVRNAVDHGIETVEERIRAGKPETGRIHLCASHIEDHVLITIEDDGKGIDSAKVLKRAIEMNVAAPDSASRMKESELLNLVFTPGLSAKDEVTEVSGRGVGMDVVRTNIEKLNGSVFLESRPGKGAKLSIKLPLTLAIIKSLLVAFGKRIFAVPLVTVAQTLRIERSELQTVSGRETVMFRGGALPLLRIDNVYGLSRKPGETEPEKVYIVVVSWSGKRAGLIVDSLIGDMDIVIRPLGEYIGEAPGISGAAILGDGNIALIVDVGGIIQMSIEEGDVRRTLPAGSGNGVET